MNRRSETRSDARKGLPRRLPGSISPERVSSFQCWSAMTQNSWAGEGTSRTPELRVSRRTGTNLAGMGIDRMHLSANVAKGAAPAFDLGGVVESRHDTGTGRTCGGVARLARSAVAWLTECYSGETSRSVQFRSGDSGLQPEHPSSYGPETDCHSRGSDRPTQNNPRVAGSATRQPSGMGGVPPAGRPGCLPFNLGSSFCPSVLRDGGCRIPRIRQARSQSLSIPDRTPKPEASQESGLL